MMQKIRIYFVSAAEPLVDFDRARVEAVLSPELYDIEFRTVREQSVGDPSDSGNIDNLDAMLQEKFHALVDIETLVGSAPNPTFPVNQHARFQSQKVLFAPKTKSVNVKLESTAEDVQLRFFSILAIEFHGQALCPGVVECVPTDQVQNLRHHPRRGADDTANTELRFAQRQLSDYPLRCRLVRLAQDLLNEYAVKDFGVVRLDLSVNAADDARITDFSIDHSLRLFTGRDLLNDDAVIQCLPGSYNALFALLLSNLDIHLDRTKNRSEVNRDNFNALATMFNDFFEEMPHNQLMSQIVQSNDWSGRVLDVGCGTGVFGKLLKQFSSNNVLIGIDVADAMVTSQDIRENYELPIRVGDMETMLLQVGQVDHVVSFSVFQYVDTVTFLATVCQMFCVASGSVTFDVPEISEEYLRLLSEGGEYERLMPVDHSVATRVFGVPIGWKKTGETRIISYVDPEFSIDVYSSYHQFERIH